MPSQDLISQNLQEVRREIAEACERSGRDPQDVTLCVVSKTQAADRVVAASQAGAVVFGENRVQELLGKAPDCPRGLEWHIIGHLQANKVRKALGVAHTIQSVDSLELTRSISRIAREMGRNSVRILLQVNIAGDPAKHGWEPGALEAALPSLLTLPQLEIAGLMTIPEIAETAEQARPHFAALRQFRDRLQAQCGHPLPHLSMGMSGDFAAAVEEGATIVRVGSRIFGQRPDPEGQHRLGP